MGLKEESVRSVERAFSILRCFTLDSSRLNLMTISDAISLPTSTTLRLLTTLVALGMLRRNDDRTYSLGNEVFLLGAVARAHFRLQQVALPYMNRLRDDTNEAVSLYGIEGEDRVCYEHVPSKLSMRCDVRVGDRFPLWAGAGGKVMLAYEPEAVIEREALKLKRITDTTIVDRDVFMQEMAEIRRCDYSLSRGEREDGILSVAVPIFSREKRAPYSLSLAAPASRFDANVMNDVVPRLQQIATEIAGQIFAL